MQCLRPNFAYQSKHKNPITGRFDPTFSRSSAYVDLPKIELPCGNCSACAVNAAEDWAIRISHESRMHKFSMFATATYDAENMQVLQSQINERMMRDGVDLVEARKAQMVEDHQRFLKRLRKYVRPVVIKFFAAAELGDKSGREHIHYVVFGVDFLAGSQKATGTLYRNPMLEKLWGKGSINFGEVNDASASYVAQYATKKQDGNAVFKLQSLKPAIGYSFVDKFGDDIIRAGGCVRGKNIGRVPKSYIRRDRERFAKISKAKADFAAGLAAVPLADRVSNAETRLLNRAAKNRAHKSIDRTI